MKGIYKNKKTGKIIVSSQKMSKDEWELVREVCRLKVYNTKMNNNQIMQK